MSKGLLCAILVQILVLIYSQYNPMTLDIKRSKAHIDKTGDLTPLVVTLSSEDINEKVKPVDLICIVDVSSSMLDEDKIGLVKETLKYLINLMNEEDRLAIIKFSYDAELAFGFAKMYQGNKRMALSEVEDLYAYGGTNTYSGLEKALEKLTDDYSTGERIATIILLSDGLDNYGRVPERFETLLNTTKKDNYTFTLHTFGYGTDHDPDSMTNLAKIHQGGFLYVDTLQAVKDYYLIIYGSSSSICNVNLNLTVQSNFNISLVYFIEDMYKASLLNETSVDNKTKTISFSTILIQAIYGKQYSYVFLVDVPNNTPLGTEVLNATVSPLGLKAKFLWDKTLDSIAYEEYIRCICVNYFSRAFYAGEYNINYSITIIEEGIEWIRVNYTGTRDWIGEFNGVLLDLDKFDTYGRPNLLSKIYELKTLSIGGHYSMVNSYVKSIIDSSHNIDVNNLTYMRVRGEKIIDFEINMNYYYFYLKEGSGIINNLYFYGVGSSLFIYSDNSSGKIKITSLSEYIELYYTNITKSRSLNMIDFCHGGKFIMEKDFPYEFYTSVDGSKDITFNIEFLKFEFNEAIKISEHLFEISANIILESDINFLNNNPDFLSENLPYYGYYDSSLSLGALVIKKEDILKYKTSSVRYQSYLYVMIKKSSKENITYNHVEGQFIFVSMDYIYSTIPTGFLISSHLSEGQRSPHLYTFEGRNITIEIINLGVELECKVIKYKLYQTGSEELYVDYSSFTIIRRKVMKKIYIDVIQKRKENEADKLILSIFANNTGHVASDNITNISYSFRYENHTYNDVDDNSTDFISDNNTDNIANTDDITEKKSEEKIDPIIPPTPSYPTANVFLLGYAKYTYIKTIKISYFSVYFGCIRQVIYTKILIVTVKIKYKVSLRQLQDETTQAKCELLDNEFENINKFNCSVNTTGEDIDNIEIEKYEFQNQSVNIIGETAISKSHKNNLQNVGDSDLFNKKLYILDNATRSIDNDNNEFNITGTINDTNFNYEKVRLTLNSKDSNDGPQRISCEIIKKSDVDCILNCKTDEEMKAELDGVFGDLGNENLIVNFIDGGNSTIDFESHVINSGFRFKSKKSGLSAGAIVAIILSCVIALIIVISLIVCLKNRKVPTYQDSTNANITSTNLN